MRIVMPLFQFSQISSETFHFSGKQIRIEKYNADEEIPDTDLFSKFDIDNMNMESWALIFEDEDIIGYKSKINLLLLSFRIFSQGKPPFIKYRLCKKNIGECTRINSTMTYIHEFENKCIPYTIDNLFMINSGFNHLSKMDKVSSRCHNALYFLYLGFHNTHWISSFVFLMNTLEALFSKDELGAATNTICKRVSSFLRSKLQCKYDDINHLYDIRSRIVHGNIEVQDEPIKILKELNNLQYITIKCMEKFLQEEIYLHFDSKKNRDCYFEKFN